MKTSHRKSLPRPGQSATTSHSRTIKPPSASFISLPNILTCAPEAAVVAGVKKLHIVAVKDIEKGEVLNMNYLTCRALLALENTQPSLFSTPKRIEGLRSIYGVDCDCSHCEDWALFEKFACPACKASSRSGLKRNSLPRNPDPAPWKCQTCQMVSDTALDGPSAPLRDEPSFNSGLDRTYDKYKEPLLYMRCLLTETQQILPDHGVVFEGLVLMLMQTAGKWVARVGSGMIVLGRRTIKDVDPAAYIALLTYGEVHFDQNEQNAVGAVRETNRKVQRLVQ